MIIAIEGIDGSGKNTQAKILAQRLSIHGKAVKLMGFPCYADTLFGKEIGSYLNGEFGSITDVSPKLASMLYAGDRFEKKAEINEALNSGMILIIDRYVSSNIAHQSAKVFNEQRIELQRWIESLEYGVYSLPKPDINILLNLDASTSSQLVSMKNTREYTSKKHDLHEENSEYLSEVAKVYRSLSENNDEWIVINCIESGVLKSIDSISDEIYSTIKQYI
ncbi:dTMP kinase [Citrobacter freundii]|uniref:dTMP kinase n=1 Tax=Citrobacter freundii TaxID=546 RepID=UPI0017837818|nr:dTMP kinase [Citrobacter freundii]MBD9989720.1 dTMP kinase [Citrobacter freundii]MBE0053617.1 dTMP kinase [Citrobacter freundii]MBE4703552.1 dTMP kinase [Citrobacter freundii]MDT7287918.1 dTMP kinase [Citrobacter freundii]HBU6166845.1 dTMP kinase [Citrobacter freundii]